jgi:hypothetical protein
MQGGRAGVWPRPWSTNAKITRKVALAYGGKSCSIKYKKTPQDRYVAG